MPAVPALGRERPEALQGEPGLHIENLSQIRIKQIKPKETTTNPNLRQTKITQPPAHTNENKGTPFSTPSALSGKDQCTHHLTVKNRGPESIPARGLTTGIPGLSPRYLLAESLV